MTEPHATGPVPDGPQGPQVPGGPDDGAPPVCPRHPDRASYVRCQRCGRPACPECQRPAAVGVHCVDCVREANRTAAPVRSQLGARLRPGGRPVVTLTIVAVSVVSYLLQLTLGTTWTALWIFWPAGGAYEPWRFVTTAFLHAPMLLHIGFNMYALWIVGQWLEPALGRWRFAALYLLSALGGSVAVLLLASPTPDGGWFQGVVGASGAVFGLFGAVLVVLRRLGRSARPIVAILLVNGVIGFVVPQIAWEAHLGGLLVGAGLGAAFAYAPRARRVLVSGVAVAVVLVLLVALAGLKYALV